MNFAKTIFIFVIMLSSKPALPDVFFASRSFNLGGIKFISWHIEKNITEQRSSRCYAKYQEVSFDSFHVEIGFPCQSKERFINWINSDNKANYVELNQRLLFVKRLIDYLFQKELRIKLRIILTFEDSSIKKNFFNLTSKYIPINIIAQFDSQGTHIEQSYANLSFSIVHEITHLYQKQFIKSKFKQASGQTQEALAEIAGTCGLIIMGELGLEDVFSPSFKNDFRNNIPAFESLMRSNYGKMIFKNNPKTISRSVGYIKGRYALWSIFGESVNSEKKSEDIFKFCKYVIHEMPDIDEINYQQNSSFLKLDSFLYPKKNKYQE